MTTNLIKKFFKNSFLFGCLSFLILASFSSIIPISAQEVDTLQNCADVSDNAEITICSRANNVTCEALGRQLASQTTCGPLIESSNNQPATQTQIDNGGSGSRPAQGFDFIQILPFDCIFNVAGRCENGLLDAVIDFLFTLAIPLAVLVITWGGYRYFFGGFQGKLEGMQTIQAAVIGLALVFSARLITDTVNDVFSTNDGFNVDALTPLIESITNGLVTLSLVLAVLVIVWGGYQYFFGGFDSKSEGLKTIQAGVVGLIVISLANFIANTTADLFRGIESTDDAANIATQIGDILTPILLQITTVLQGLAALIAVLVIIWGGYQYFFSTLPNGKKDGLETLSKGIIGLVVVILATPIVTLVDRTINVQNQQLSLDPSNIIYTIQTIVTNFLIPISAAVTVFLFILGAYQWVTSNGSQEKVKKGQDSIKNAVIGLIVILLATTITQIVVFLFSNAELNDPSIPDVVEQSEQGTIQETTSGSGGGSGLTQPTPE